MTAQASKNGFDELVTEHDKLGLSPAITTALFQKPHDRQFIIELENLIVSFINSNAESYELRPMNSYYRLLSHQIAEFHGLKHALARAHDNCVIIFKGDGYQKVEGRPLLQELEPISAEPLATSGSPSLDYLSQTQDAKSARKYKILRRREGQDCSTTSPAIEGDNSSMNTYVDPNDSEANLELQRIEREKEYEQRKQEIFDTPKKDDKDLSSVNDLSSDKDGDGSSPQPYQFETSRYRFRQTDGSPPPQPRYNNRRKKSASHAGYKDRRYQYRHEHNFNQNENNGSFPMPYNMAYMMYNTPPITSHSANAAPFPVVYSAPFPADGSSAYLPPFMYQPITGGVVNSKGTLPAAYMPYPFPFPYGQQQPNLTCIPQDPQHQQSHFHNSSYRQNYPTQSYKLTSKNGRTRSNSSLSSSRSSGSSRKYSPSADDNEQPNGTLNHKEYYGANMKDGDIKKSENPDLKEVTEGLQNLTV